MNKFDFDNAPWHDAELQALHIARTRPGVADEVYLQVGWPDGSTTTVKFQDCYKFSCTMNFGVVAAETIREASSVSDSGALDEIRERWAALGVSLADLKEFRITTSSTASNLAVFARTVTNSTRPSVEAAE